MSKPESKAPTDEEVMLEIARLIDLKDQVRERNIFGDSNKEAIEVQIDVLVGQLGEDEAYSQFGDGADGDGDRDQDGNECLLSAALDAIGWRDATRTNGPPSEDWLSLVD